jgi:VCBS repeat-containing protein
MNGALDMRPAGGFLYQPNPGFCGVDSFTYMASDGNGQSAVRTVRIDVLCDNDVPVANDDAFSTDEDVRLDVDAPGVVANDVEPDGDQVTAVLVQDVQHGILALRDAGSFSYIPEKDFFGTDTFIYRLDDGTTQSNTATVTLTVHPVGDAPVGKSDIYTMTENTTLDVGAPGVLANDEEVDGNPLTATLTSGVANGSLSLSANGSFSYTPNPDWRGTEEFYYVADNGNGTSAPTLVRISVRR